jgi:hypothetical protein
MFVPALADATPPEGEDILARSSHCWCNLTLSETGPDDRPVGPEICKTSRPCFEE